MLISQKWSEFLEVMLFWNIRGLNSICWPKECLQIIPHYFWDLCCFYRILNTVMVKLCGNFSYFLGGLRQRYWIFFLSRKSLEGTHSLTLGIIFLLRFFFDKFDQMCFWFFVPGKVYPSLNHSISEGEKKQHRKKKACSLTHSIQGANFKLFPEKNTVHLAETFIRIFSILT